MGVQRAAVTTGGDSNESTGASTPPPAEPPPPPCPASVSPPEPPVEPVQTPAMQRNGGAHLPSPSHAKTGGAGVSHGQAVRLSATQMERLRPMPGPTLSVS